MKHPRALILALTLCAAAIGVACSSSSIVGPHDLRLFVNAKARWDARPFADYSYEVRTSCFCPPEINAWTRITVRNGIVVSAEPVDPNPQFPITTLTLWSPIDTLFSRLYRDLTRPSDWIAKIDVEYDDDLGFPTLIERHEKPTVADAASVMNVRNVRALD